MKLVVISPEYDDPRESTVLQRLFTDGLQRYHVRKPHMTSAQLDAWLGALPADSRARLILHQHHELVARHALGGRHWRDDSAAPLIPPPGVGMTSRSCHDFATLQAALGRYDSVFYAPVYPSLSKPGYGPLPDSSHETIAACLARRTAAERRTAVFALGGITAANAARTLALGFDGVAVLGAIWHAADPVRAFTEIHATLLRHAA